MTTEEILKLLNTNLKSEEEIANWWWKKATTEDPMNPDKTNAWKGYCIHNAVVDFIEYLIKEIEENKK